MSVFVYGNFTMPTPPIYFTVSRSNLLGTSGFLDLYPPPTTYGVQLYPRYIHGCFCNLQKRASWMGERGGEGFHGRWF